MLYREPGSDRVIELLDQVGIVALISAVNLSEVYASLLSNGMSEDEAFRLLMGLQLTVVPFTEADAYRAGRLRSKVASFGLSFGDRACLALAEAKDAVAWTADHAWSKVKIGVVVELIRQRSSSASE